MGRQSSRIWLANNTDHKEMVTWTGTEYMYHDKAYIWNGSTFDLVWEKLPYELKLLYDTNLVIKPSASGNNKYLYFAENNDESIIYRIVIDAEDPQKTEYWTSETYNEFNAPVSSQGIAMHYVKDSNTQFSYRMFNLDTGEVTTAGVFDAVEEGFFAPQSVGTPTIGQDLSIGFTGNPFASTLSLYLAGQAYAYKYYLYIIGFVDGVSFYNLDNVESSFHSIFSGLQGSLGKYDGDFLPRFLYIDNGSIGVIEFGAGTEYGMYSVRFSEEFPFTLRPLAVTQIGPVRDKKMWIYPDDLHVWIAEIKSDSIEYTDTGLECEVSTDVSPDFEYAIVTERAYEATPYVDAKIVRIADKKTVISINSAIGDMDPIQSVYFVGKKCIYVGGYVNGAFRHRLYKWR